MELHRLIYVSRAVDGSDVDLWALTSILHAAERNNHQNGLTGLLLAHEGFFCQALEGAPAAIHGLMKVLESDRRHADIRILCDDPLGERAFSDWTMAQVVVTPALIAQLGDVKIEDIQAELALGVLAAAAAHLRAST